MKSLNQLVQPVKDVLTAISDNVGHFEANDRTKSFIIYAEDNEASSVEADNKKQYLRLDVYIDAYLLEKDMAMADSIQQGLNQKNIPFRLESISYDDNTQYHFIHYRWRCEVD